MIVLFLAGCVAGQLAQFALDLALDRLAARRAERMKRDLPFPALDFPFHEREPDPQPDPDPTTPDDLAWLQRCELLDGPQARRLARERRRLVEDFTLER